MPCTYGVFARIQQRTVRGKNLGRTGLKLGYAAIVIAPLCWGQEKITEKSKKVRLKDALSRPTRKLRKSIREIHFIAVLRMRAMSVGWFAIIESSRFALPNFNGAGGFSRASFEGDGWGEEVPGLASIRKLMESLPVLRNLHGDHDSGRKTPRPDRCARGGGDGAAVAKRRFMESSVRSASYRFLSNPRMLRQPMPARVSAGRRRKGLDWRPKGSNLWL